MNDAFIKKILSLQAAEFLKSKNIPIHVAVKAILGNDPKVLAEKLAACEQISEIFPRPFEIPLETNGAIRFAKTEKNRPVGINIDELLQGMIIGSPGSGKSMMSYSIALQAMAMGVKCWFFTKGNDTEKMISFRKDLLVDDFNGQRPKNFLPPPPNYSRDNWTSIHWDIFIQAITLYDGTKNFLTSQYFDLYEMYKKHNAEPSFYEIYDFLKARRFPNYSRDARYNESALNRIGGMLKGSLRKDLNCSSSHLQDLVFQNTIFNYKGLSAEASVYVINALIAWLAAYKESNRTDIIHLMILDDGMHVFDANRLDRRPDMGIGYINHIIFETRKFQIKFLTNIQIPSLISKGILGTSNFKSLLNIPNANEINFMLDILGVHQKEQREYAQRLNNANREMIVKVPQCSEPFLANIPDSPLAHEMDLIEISSEKKFENNRRILEGFSKALPRVPYQNIIRLNFEAAKSNPDSASQSSKASPDLPKNETEKKISDSLMAVNLYQYKKTITEIYQLANLSAGTGSRIAKICEKRNLIKIIKISFGRGRPRYPVLLPEGYSFLGIEAKKYYGKGAGHEHVLYQHLIKDYFSKFEAEIELNRGGKFMDVGITVDEKLIAIEVAMSTKNEKNNIEKDILKAKANFVIVACKDRKVQGQVENIVSDMSEEFCNKTKVCLIGDLLKIKPDELVAEVSKENKND